MLTKPLYLNDRNDEPFDISSILEGGFISAGAGSGKSFFIQFLVIHAQRNIPVCVLDFGGSYRKVCETLNGNYQGISEISDKDISISKPFQVFDFESVSRKCDPGKSSLIQHLLYTYDGLIVADELDHLPPEIVTTCKNKKAIFVAQNVSDVNKNISEIFTDFGTRIFLKQSNYSLQFIESGTDAKFISLAKFTSLLAGLRVTGRFTEFLFCNNTDNPSVIIFTADDAGILMAKHADSGDKDNG